MAKNSVENEKLIAVLSYFLVGIIWYFVDENAKKSSFIKFHVKQSLNLFIISFAVSLVLSIVFSILSVITLGIFAVVAVPVMMLLNVAILVLWVLGIVYSIQNEEKEIPVIGKFADKYLTF